MASATRMDSKTSVLARRIAEDIRRRGMREGDPYLTSDAVGEMLGVHSRMAGRAMQQLAEEELLVRRRGSGTFVGPAVNGHKPVKVRCVNILITAQRLDTGLSTGDLVDGVRVAMPGFDIQLNFLPAHDAEGHVRQLLAQSAENPATSGVIMIGCPLAVQQIVAEYKIPTVVLGSVYPSTEAVPSIDVDHYQAGRLLARYLIERGHRKIALVTRDMWLAGDNHLLDGINDEIAEAKLPPGVLSLRSLPTDATFVEQELEHLLANDDAPTGLIARGRLYAQAADRVIDKLPDEKSEKIDMVFESSGEAAEEAVCRAHVRPTYDFEHHAREAGRMLREFIDGKTPELRHELVPMEIVEPESALQCN